MKRILCLILIIICFFYILKAISKESNIPCKNAPYKFITSWGSKGTDGGQFDVTGGIAIDSKENIYVVDVLNKRIQKFDSNGKFILKWGDIMMGGGPLEFGPADIAITSDNYIYVTDPLNQRILKFDSNGNLILKWDKTRYDIGGIVFISIDKNNDIYANDRCYMYKFSSEGELLKKWQLERDLDKYILCHEDFKDIDTDSSGNVFVLFHRSSEHKDFFIQKLDTSGDFIKEWCYDKKTLGEIYEVSGLAIDREDNMFISDGFSIIKLDPSGKVITRFYLNYKDCFCSGIEVDCHGNLYVTDLKDYCIQKFAPNLDFKLEK